MLQDIERLPRSISESGDWRPDWRNRQAMAYLDAYRHRVELQCSNGCQDDSNRSLLRNVRFPAWEDDPIVKARFRHLVGAAVAGSEWTAAFDLGEQLIRANPDTLEVAAIKGLLLTGLTDEEIAARHSLTPFQVRVFHDTWFDVRSCMLETNVLLRILCDNPPASDPAGWQERERRILWVALACGIETLDYQFNPTDRLRGEYTQEELEWLAKTRRRARAAVNRSRAGAAARK